MNKRMVLYGVAATMLGWAGLVAAAPRDTLETIEKEISEKWTKVKTMSGKMTMTADMATDDGSSKSESTGTYEYRKTGDKIAYRMDAKYSMVNNFGGQEMKMDSTVTSISDGEFMYMLTEQMGQKTAMKMKTDSSQSMDAAGTLATLREHNDLKALADQTIDGQAVYVIEATAKNAASSPVPRTLMYIAKDTGVVVKTVGFDQSGKEATVMVFSDIKINEDIPADRFVFKAPPGVTVTDMSGE